MKDFEIKFLIDNLNIKKKIIKTCYNKCSNKDKTLNYQCNDRCIEFILKNEDISVEKIKNLIIDT